MITFNALSCGLIGDGINDDTAAVQAMMSAVPARGGDIYFPTPPVRYRFTGSIGLPHAPVTIRGDALDASELCWDTDVDGLVGAFTGFYTGPPTIRDLSLTTKVPNGTKAALTLRYPDAGSVNECHGIIERVNIRPYGHTAPDMRWGKGIVLDGAWNARVRNVFIHGANNQPVGMQHAIHLTNKSLDVDIDDCTIFGAAIAILCDGQTEGSRISDVTMMGCNYGVFFNNSPQHPWAVVRDCHIAARIKGIYASYRPQATFEGNLIYKAGDSVNDFVGIHLTSAAGGSTVQGNKFVVQAGSTGSALGILIDGGAELVNANNNSSVGCLHTVLLAADTKECTAIGNTRQGGLSTVRNDAPLGMNTVGLNHG